MKVWLAYVGTLAAAVSPAPFGDLTELERSDLVAKGDSADALRSLVPAAGAGKRRHG